MTFDRADMKILNKHKFQPFFNEMAKEQSPLSFFNLPKLSCSTGSREILFNEVHSSRISFYEGELKNSGKVLLLSRPSEVKRETLSSKLNIYVLLTDVMEISLTVLVSVLHIE